MQSTGHTVSADDICVQSPVTPSVRQVVTGGDAIDKDSAPPADESCSLHTRRTGAMVRVGKQCCNDDEGPSGND